jgi:hypothetical protein
VSSSQSSLPTSEDLDLAIARLTEEEGLAERKKAAEKKAGEMASSVYKDLRKLCKTDLFFLSTGILGHDRMSPRLHGHVCSWMRKTRLRQFREFLLPRGHFKSTLITQDHSVQCILPDDTGGESWPECLGPEIRMVIAHEVAEQAEAFLYAITDSLMSNEVLMALFPEIVPNPKKQRINRSNLELPRKRAWPEPTIATMSTGSRGQGRHYNYMKLDDLIGDKARDSKTEMDAAKQWLNNIQAFFSTFKKDKFDLVGTRWSMDDIYAHMERMYEDELLVYRRAVLEDGSAIFPEEFTAKQLQIIQKDNKVWTAQYLNDPREGTQDFDPTWLRYYNWSGDGKSIIIFDRNLDGTPKAPREYLIADMDIVILIDPAMSGKAGYLITGVTDDRKIVLLKAKKHKWKPPELTDEVFTDVIKWQPRAVVVEKVLFSGLFANYWNAEMQLRNLRFNVVPHAAGNKDKSGRVRGLTNYFCNGQIYCHPEQRDFIEEYHLFGSTDDYHLLDALAQGPDHWKFGGRTAKKWSERQQFEAQMLARRDRVTGYSSI